MGPAGVAATGAAATRASTGSNDDKALSQAAEPQPSRWKQHFTTDVDPVWADLLLILCFFISGIVDSVAFDVWACFASMQTGMYPPYTSYLRGCQ